MAALGTLYQRIIDPCTSPSLPSDQPLPGPGGSRRTTFLRRLLGASIATFGLNWAGAPAADAANFTCLWNDATANWTTAADWSSCNSTFPNNGAGNSYNATISTGDPTLTTAVTIGSVTINSPGTWTLTGSGASAALTGTLANSGAVSLQNGASLATAGGLSNAGTLVVNTGGSLNVAGTLSNSASTTVGQPGLASPTIVTAGGLVNTGVFNIESGTATATVTTPTLTNTGVMNISGGTAQAALKIGSPAPATWTGTVQLQVGDALLQFTGASQITTIGNNASIVLDSPQAFVAAAGINSTSNSALTGLTTIASGGRLLVENGASVTTSGGLTINSASAGFGGGALTVSGGLSGSSTLDVMGTLSNHGLVTISTCGICTGTNMVTASALDNTGYSRDWRCSDESGDLAAGHWLDQHRLRGNTDAERPKRSGAGHW
jgi:hypothetical protein